MSSACGELGEQSRSAAPSLDFRHPDCRCDRCSRVYANLPSIDTAAWSAMSMDTSIDPQLLDVCKRRVGHEETIHPSISSKNKTKIGPLGDEQVVEEAHHLFS